MTSDQLFKSSKKNVRFRITAKGGVSLPISCELCVNSHDAEAYAFKMAKEYAKTLRGVKLHKKVSNCDEKVIYDSKALEKANFITKANKLFTPIRRLAPQMTQASFQY